MRLWLIRHAEAVDREAFSGDDLARPLTEKGIRWCEAGFKKLASLCEPPDLVISSQAVRARQTAELFCRAYGISFEETDRLNPGCSFDAMRGIVESTSAGTRSLALIGHEPDLSAAAGAWLGDRALNIKLKKGSLLELRMNTNETVSLHMLLPLKLLAES